MAAEDLRSTADGDDELHLWGRSLDEPEADPRQQPPAPEQVGDDDEDSIVEVEVDLGDEDNEAAPPPDEAAPASFAPSMGDEGWSLDTSELNAVGVGALAPEPMPAAAAEPKPPLEPEPEIEPAAKPEPPLAEQAEAVEEPEPEPLAPEEAPTELFVEDPAEAPTAFASVTPPDDAAGGALEPASELVFSTPMPAPADLPPSATTAPAPAAADDQPAEDQAATAPLDADTLEPATEAPAAEAPAAEAPAAPAIVLPRKSTFSGLAAVVPERRVAETDRSTRETPAAEAAEMAAVSVAVEDTPADRPLDLDLIPLDKPSPEGDNTWLTNYSIFKAVSQKLARVGGWKQLAACAGYALVNAPYAAGATRPAMLLDLARIYRDRLKDQRRAEQAFAALARDDAANAEALSYLTEVYQKRGDWSAMYDLYLTAVEATWDPNERLAWTREAAEIATDRLDQVDLAIKAWERLWQLGDAMDEATRELTGFYRRAERWSQMAEFLAQRAERQQGPGQLVTLRELAEVKLSGEQATADASAVLEQIVERSPQDAIATLQLARVYARREDWEGLERLGDQAANDAVHQKAALDLQRLAADALWRAGRLEPAVKFYDRLLEADPADHDGTTRKHEYLTRTQKYDELLALLVDKADSTDDDDERAELLAEAAALAEEKLGSAEQAVTLWERRITIDSEHLPSYEALSRLYETLGDYRGIARAHGGQLSLTKEPKRRIELLRQLGEHFARKIEDDEKAERCWKEILDLDPTDLPAREDLIDLHRRRGDFEALNSALMRQIWLTSDEERAENLCRLAAENLDQNFDEPPRSIEAWRRVLDFSPLDLQALEALAGHYAKLDGRRDLIATLEQQIRAVGEEKEHRIALALQVADLWRAAEVPKAAAATYERILRWDPVNGNALEALVAIYAASDQQGKAIGALDQASVLTVDNGRRISLLRQSLSLLPADDRRARFFHLRRILALSYGTAEVLGQLEGEAAAAGEAPLWPEMAAVLVDLASRQDDDAARLELRRQLATVYEKHLGDKPRAFLALQTALLVSDGQRPLLDEMLRLGRATGRFEDLLALLDRLTTPEFELDERKLIIHQRSAICEQDLGDPLRAFHEQRRLLVLDPVDWEPLEALDRLAGVHGLWHELDAVLAELWDRTTSSRDRADLLKRREAIARDKLERRDGAFDLLLRRFRLEPDSVELLKSITSDAEEIGGWDWLLPLLEAAQLAPQKHHSAEELALTAALYEDKLEDLDRAFVLYAEAFVIDPSVGDLPDKLEALAGKIARYEALADTLRMAAAHTADPEQQLALLRRIAGIYERRLSQPERAIDIHRRLLDLKQDELASLEVMIDWHRGRSEWRDLRDRLYQWVHLAPESDDRVPKLLEIARLAQEHLEDPEAALESYGMILEIDGQHAEARSGLNGLVESITEPGLRLRWLRMELKNVEGERAVTLRLEIAAIQESEQQDIEGAAATLQALVDDAGADGPGFIELRRLLRDNDRHRELVLLLRARARQVEAQEEKLAALDEALAVCHEHIAGREPELHEELYRFLLELRPADRGTRVRLARLLRGAGRFDDLCQVLDGQLEVAEDEADELATSFQLARLRARNLEQLDQATKVWQTILDRFGDNEGALLALALAAADRGDVAGYVELRHRQAKALSPKQGALVLCYLAEICDETPELSKRMVGFYREARAMDPENLPAMEALKGIGRRLKSLRPAAALLPLDGERDLDASERAKRLKGLGDASLERDQEAALEWYRRAVAVDPDAPAAWEALAAACEATGDKQGVLDAGRCWLQTIQRTTALDLDQLKIEAERLYTVALAARAAGHGAEYAALIRQAYELVPQHAPAALAWAEALIEEERFEQAHDLLDEILTLYRDELSDDQRVAAHYARGVTLRRLDRRDEAIANFREALHIAPLDADCLVAMGEAQAEAGRDAAALEDLIRALIVIGEPQRRAQLFYRIGLLWEDGLAAFGEAGACYEQALAEGMAEPERDLLHRALRHYQRTGRLDESLEVVDGLLPTAEDPDELATLWQVRGEIFAARAEGQDAAIEAFDMALSYDPSRQAARDGLTAVLEQRGDWDQLLQVLEASCDVGSPAQRAAALQRMADISADALGDPTRAEAYLKASIDAHPTRQALEQLEATYAERPDQVAEHKDVLGLLVGFGPPWLGRTLELSRLLLADDKRWAWTMLSPLLGVSQIDPDMKAVVQAMRKEYERAPMFCPADPEAYWRLIHADADERLLAVLAELEELVHPLGVDSLEAAGDGAAIAISPQSVLGKAFAAVQGKVDIGGDGSGGAGCTLHRTQQLPESICIVNSRPEPAVVVRTEVMQQLVHAEVGFLFAASLCLCRPGFRGIAALAQDQRERLVPSLFRAIGLAKPGKKVSRLEAQIREQVDEEVRDRWAAELHELAAEDPQALGRRYWSAAQHTARRAGLLAGADLRQAFRVLARLEPELPRPRVVARLEELDEYVGGSEILKELVAFAASPTFGQLLAGGVIAEP